MVLQSGIKNKYIIGIIIHFSDNKINEIYYE